MVLPGVCALRPADGRVADPPPLPVGCATLGVYQGSDGGHPSPGGSQMPLTAPSRKG